MGNSRMVPLGNPAARNNSVGRAANSSLRFADSESQSFPIITVQRYPLLWERDLLRLCWEELSYNSRILRKAAFIVVFCVVTGALLCSSAQQLNSARASHIVL